MKRYEFLGAPVTTLHSQPHRFQNSSATLDEDQFCTVVDEAPICRKLNQPLIYPNQFIRKQLRFGGDKRGQRRRHPWQHATFLPDDFDEVMTSSEDVVHNLSFKSRVRSTGNCLKCVRLYFPGSEVRRNVMVFAGPALDGMKGVYDDGFFSVLHCGVLVTPVMMMKEEGEEHGIARYDTQNTILQIECCVCGDDYDDDEILIAVRTARQGVHLFKCTADFHTDALIIEKLINCNQSSNFILRQFRTKLTQLDCTLYASLGGSTMISILYEECFPKGSQERKQFLQRFYYHDVIENNYGMCQLNDDQVILLPSKERYHNIESARHPMCLHSVATSSLTQENLYHLLDVRCPRRDIASITWNIGQAELVHRGVYCSKPMQHELKVHSVFLMNSNHTLYELDARMPSVRPVHIWKLPHSSKPVNKTSQRKGNWAPPMLTFADSFCATQSIVGKPPCSVVSMNRSTGSSTIDHYTNTFIFQPPSSPPLFRTPSLDAGPDCFIRNGSISQTSVYPWNDIVGSSRFIAGLTTTRLPLEDIFPLPKDNLEVEEGRLLFCHEHKRSDVPKYALLVSALTSSGEIHCQTLLEGDHSFDHKGNSTSRLPAGCRTLPIPEMTFTRHNNSLRLILLNDESAVPEHKKEAVLSKDQLLNMSELEYKDILKHDWNSTGTNEAEDKLEQTECISLNDYIEKDCESPIQEANILKLGTLNSLGSSKNCVDIERISGGPTDLKFERNNNGNGKVVLPMKSASILLYDNTSPMDKSTTDVSEVASKNDSYVDFKKESLVSLQKKFDEIAPGTSHWTESTEGDDKGSDHIFSQHTLSQSSFNFSQESVVPVIRASKRSKKRAG